MGNSLHSDNPICPVNVIVPDPKFFNSIPKSPNPMPLPFEKRFRVFIPQFSAFFQSEESEQIQISKYVEQKTFRSEQRRNPREIILECLSEGRDTGFGSPSRRIHFQ